MQGPRPSRHQEEQIRPVSLDGGTCAVFIHLGARKVDPGESGPGMVYAAEGSEWEVESPEVHSLHSRYFIARVLIKEYGGLE